MKPEDVSGLYSPGEAQELVGFNISEASGSQMTWCSRGLQSPGPYRTSPSCTFQKHRRRSGVGLRSCPLTFMGETPRGRHKVQQTQLGSGHPHLGQSRGSGEFPSGAKKQDLGQQGQWESGMVVLAQDLPTRQQELGLGQGDLVLGQNSI